MSLEHQPDLNLRSEEAQDFLAAPPAGILRWGSGVLFVALSLIIGATLLVRFPEIVSARAVLTTEHPPVRVVARSNGRIESLLVKDFDSVRKGQALALLDNGARLADVSGLDSLLGRMAEAVGESLPALSLPQNLVLGELQSVYSVFVKNYQDFRFFAAQNAATQRQADLNAQINRYKELNVLVEKQLANVDKELALVQRATDIVDTAFRIGGNSELEWIKAKTDFERLKSQREVFFKEITTNNLHIAERQKEINDLGQDAGTDYADKLRTTREALLQLRSEIRLWRQRYVVEAPVSGRVSMHKPLIAQQFVALNQDILSIVPNGSEGVLLAKLWLPDARSGKVRPGSRVRLKFDRYPYREHGLVWAEVVDISLVPDADGNRLVTLALQNGLRTNTGKILVFAQEMQAAAEIVTEERSVLGYLLDR